MEPQDLFNDGRLAEAILAQTRALAAKASPEATALLCDMLGFAGRFAEIRTHMGELPAHSLWSAVIDAAELRERTWKRPSPSFLIDPPDFIRMNVRRLHHLADGNDRAAADLFDKLQEMMPETDGHLDGAMIRGLLEADDRFGGVTEALIDGSRWCWIPFCQTKRIRLMKRETPGQFLYSLAEFTLEDGSHHRGYIPAVYPASYAAQDDVFRLGQETDWDELPDGSTSLKGLRLWMMNDEDEQAIWDWTQLDL